MIEPYIETYSGKKFWFLDPTDDMFDIDDIAHALSLNCRYTGHCREFYSVAEHSLLCAAIVLNTINDEDPDTLKLALTALLHDASEAYVTDLASPLKAHMPEYKEIEDGVQKALATKYDLPYPFPDIIHDADRIALKFEAEKLMVSKGEGWYGMENIVVPDFMDDMVINNFEPDEIKEHFIATFNMLIGGIHG